jgi:N-hydroxyarylamine O-acetyltransferase
VIPPDFGALSEGDLGAYLARIGIEGHPDTDLDSLRRLQRAHRLAIPFENLDIMLGHGIDVAPDAVLAKLVHNRRGGYCFEHNGLFVRALLALGFTARPLMARVWLGPVGDIPPRTHMLVLVSLDGRQWAVDVGFGGSFTPPLPLDDGTEADTPDGARHRLRHAAMAGDPDGEWLLEREGPSAATDGRAGSEGWQAQYGFSLRAVVPADIEQGNHWTATRPGTRFTTLCIASMVLPDGFAALTDTRLIVHRGGQSETHMVETPDAYRTLLRDMFGIELTIEDIQRMPIFASAGA